MKRHQSGFTLIEIAIVLVIIGLLLGGVLKGQELINSARMKNLTSDFRNIPLFIYSYQDKFHALPGDDALGSAHVTGATVATAITAGDLGNNRIDGKWDSTTATHESFLFWQHVRLSGIAAGSTNTGDLAAYLPRNSAGGAMGITNSTVVDNPVAGLKGSYIACSTGILGKFAKQLDVALDDGKTETGMMQTIAVQAPGAVGAAPVASTAVDDSTIYTVCMGV